MLNSGNWLLLRSPLQELFASSVKTWLAKVLVHGTVTTSLFEE